MSMKSNISGFSKAQGAGDKLGMLSSGIGIFSSAVGIFSTVGDCLANQLITLMKL